MFLSVFELYKIGIGPSSSHTMGPMAAAARFLDTLKNGSWPRPEGAVISRLRASLHGSLAYTGVGHATDRAVILGLDGATPDTIDPDGMASRLEAVRAHCKVEPSGHPAYDFDPDSDLIFDKKQALPGHPNGLAFEARDRDGRTLFREIYYSIGGGFVVTETELQRRVVEPGGEVAPDVPFPFKNASEMLEMAASSGQSIADMKRQNETVRGNTAEIDNGLDGIWRAMDACIERGLTAEGTLPGGLKVPRRARKLAEQLDSERGLNSPNPLQAN
ncbi:MAG: serine dehydratase beta chain, partial [Pseudomonadota bacterium]